MIGSVVTAAGGHRIHARVGGRRSGGRDVVLVHGLGVSSRYMVPLLRALAPSALVHAPDLPGFGRSTRPTTPYDVPRLAGALGAWMDAMRLADAVLVGNSFGCQVLVELAVTRPELAGPLVLNAPTIDPGHRSAPSQILRWLGDWRRERPSLAAVMVRDVVDCGPRWLVATFRHALSDRIEQKLPHVRSPALVVRGGSDLIVPQRWAEEAASLLPRGSLHVLPEVGHAANHSAPAALARVVAPLVQL